MDTTVLEQRIKNIEHEIADDQKQILLRKQRISDNKKVIKIYREGLARIKDGDQENTAAMASTDTGRKEA